MNYISLVLALAFCVTCATAFTPQLSNQYADKVVNQFLIGELRLRRLEPTFLSNFNTEFKEKIGIISMKVKTDYAQGNLTGLTKVYRLGNCGAPVWTNFANNATLNCTLTLDNLQVTFNGKAKYGVVPAISIKASANITRTSIRFGVTTSRLRNAPRLEKFDVISMGVVQASFTGLGPLNSALKSLKDTFASQVSGQLYSVLMYNLKPSLEAVILRAGVMPLPR